MNSNNFVSLLQKGFHITLGATTTLIETLQDPQKRSQNFSEFREKWDELSEEWASKGVMTEQEARNFVDSILKQTGGRRSSDGVPAYSDPNPQSGTSATPSPEIQLELQELTAQIAAMRAELEKLQAKDSN